MSEQLIGSWLDFYFNTFLYHNQGKETLELLSATYWAKRRAAVNTIQFFKEIVPLKELLRYHSMQAQVAKFGSKPAKNSKLP